MSVEPQAVPLEALRAFVERYPRGGRIAAHSHEVDQLALISLLNEGKSIGEVANAVGYDSAAAFSTAFKQCFGVPPSGYLRS